MYRRRKIVEPVAEDNVVVIVRARCVSIYSICDIEVVVLDLKRSIYLSSGSIEGDIPKMTVNACG